MNSTPQSNRLNIALFGCRNSGKSSLINALTGQETALVSDVPGTTTDLVHKAIEIKGLGPCVLIDTPGFDDEGKLGEMRREQTLKAIDKTDIALLLCGENIPEELNWARLLSEKRIPVILILNKSDELDRTEKIALDIQNKLGKYPVVISAKEKTNLNNLFENIISLLPENFQQPSILGDRVGEGDLVLLVMPQDIQAPKGRLILPQAQTLRELLDRRCLVICCVTEQLQATLQALSYPPKLIITDSQVFKTVYDQKPSESKLTSFSVLFAENKGDIEYFKKSVETIGNLNETSRVLIAEACTHAPQTEDIGRVKIPAMLRKKIGDKLQIDIVSGKDFPINLSAYDLIIHCGACMFNRKHVLNRVEQAKQQHVPMTNYGIVIAYLNGILDKIDF